MNKTLLLIILITVYLCNGIMGNDKFKKMPLSQNQDYKCCIPDSNLFYYKHLKSTINLDSVKISDKMNGLDAKQVEEWIQPLLNIKFIPSKSELYLKMTSFQNLESNYSSIIISINDDMPEHYLLTVNNVGKFIDGLLISYTKNLSNSDIEYDSISKTYRSMEKVISLLNNDSIKIFSLERLSKKEGIDNENDFFEELYEIDYKIDANGLINLVHQRKKLKRDYIDINF